ncbi:hypothetical protein AU476_26710 [Cupriavidus sp. UYMSc13B]|nr:hypothetical protein AU476_26710 [Cupriavidus sp. UYMSc13B]
MSEPLRLRTLRAEDLPLYRSMRALQWIGRHAELRAAAPPRGYASLVASQSGREYEGWIDLIGLLRTRYPELDRLAWYSIDERYLLELASGSELTKVLCAAGGGWSDVWLTGVVKGTMPVQTLLCLNEPGCATALFRTFPVVEPKHTLHAAKHDDILRFIVRICIGATYASLELLRSVDVGDVLLVNRPSKMLYVGTRPLARFDYEGMGIMVNEGIEPLDDDEYERRDATVRGGDSEPFAVDTLLVRVEFILQEQE